VRALTITYSLNWIGVPWLYSVIKTVAITGCYNFFKKYFLLDSPRHRFARHPSLRFAHRGGFYFLFSLPSLRQAAERVVQRSADRVSQLYAIPITSNNSLSLSVKTISISYLISLIMNTSASKKSTGKKNTGTNTTKELQTDPPISEKDEVKKAEERTNKHQKHKP